MMSATRTAPQVLSCGCELDGGRVASRCPEADRLWAELIEARDALRDNRGSGSRKGRKQSIDAFAAARDAYRVGHMGLSS